jgi:DNA adenine methylase
VTSRLKQAQIENEPADKIIKRYAFDNVLIYADPPYPMSTRTANIYAHEMTDEEHLELLDLLEQHPGPVLLSSYENEIYSERLSFVVKRYGCKKAITYVTIVHMRRTPFRGPLGVLY